MGKLTFHTETQRVVVEQNVYLRKQKRLFESLFIQVVTRELENAIVYPSESTGDEFSFPKNNNGDFAKVKINTTKFSLPFYSEHCDQNEKMAV